MLLQPHLGHTLVTARIRWTVNDSLYFCNRWRRFLIRKGIAAASLGAILEARGLNVTMLKLDPYINVDPGTMSPLQHGEVFVTVDGTETDLDLYYERFIRTTMTEEQLHDRSGVCQRDCQSCHSAHHRHD